MKLFVVALILVTFAAVYAVEIPLELKQKVKAIHNECIKESGVEETVAEKTRKGIFPEDDPKLKKHLLCFSKKLYFINDAGEFSEEAVRKNTFKSLTTEQVNTIVTKCINQKPEESAFEFWKCWRQNIPSLSAN